MKKIIGILSAVLAFGISHAQNQNSGGSQETNLQLSNAIELSFTSSNSSNMDVAFNSLSDMMNGVETAAHEVRVRSNKKFKVTVQQSSNNFSYSGNYILNTLMKVSSVMKVKVVNNNTGGSQPLSAVLAGWQSFSIWGTPVTLLNNCDPGGNQTFTVKYKATPGTNFVAGTYTVDMVYTATQQ